MKQATQNLITATMTALGLIGAGAVQAYSNDADFNCVSKMSAIDAGKAWVNPILPMASGDYVEAKVTACGDADFNRLPQGYVRAQAKWINALLPQATGEFPAYAAQQSADALFTRQVASYSREMLDRGGWVNAFVKDGNYAIGNTLLAARVGDGVTTRIAA